MSTHAKLPLELPFLQALKVIFVRLAYFGLVALINVLLLGYILPISTNPVFSLAIYISLLFGSAIVILLHVNAGKTHKVDASQSERKDKRNDTSDVDRRFAELQFVQNTTEVMAAASLSSLNVLLSSFVERIASHFGYNFVGVYVKDNEAWRLAAVNKSEEEWQERLIDNGYTISRSAGVLNDVIDHPVTRVINNVQIDPDFLADPLLPSTMSEGVFPIKVRGELIGILDIQDEQLNSFSDDDIGIFESLVEQLAIVMENNRLFHETVDRGEKLRLISEISTKIGDAAIIQNVLNDMEALLNQPLETKERAYLDPDYFSTGLQTGFKNKDIDTDENEEDKT